ncbi:hypothetical protein UFOVP98_2 [uncultured Caudovirales phage]|uniref:Uncharacterized protein n=1 Tax=uncultured Caudovirales phage TaxID=2100421 RepID=A0A6J5LQW6_9CAUD|nr:hypothetical protein UFOVP98_2 [uncultured Caudovirales phage]CAB4134059.1 hypothetical protein UFOVP269_4 [uncultured Caudovirales phage]
MQHYSNQVGAVILTPPVLLYAEVGESPPPVPNYMLLENGNLMDTEDGNTMILES